MLTATPPGVSNTPQPGAENRGHTTLPSATLTPTGVDPVDPAFLKSLREHVHDTLRKAIIAGRLRPEQRLNERQLATELGVSTTPIKEALRRLESEGLVRIEARRGIYVTFTAAQAEEMTLARAALESMIARLAARRATPGHHAQLQATVAAMAEATADGDVERLIDLNETFHGGIHAASGCHYLQRLLDGQRMYDHATRVALLTDAAERGCALQDHRRILAALCAQDADAAERAMRDHIVRSGQQHLATVFPSPVFPTPVFPTFVFPAPAAAGPAASSPTTPPLTKDQT